MNAVTVDSQPALNLCRICGSSWMYIGLGHSGIHPRVLRELTDVTVGHLSIIFQQPWQSVEILVTWKLANIVPVFRKGKKEYPAQNRPVSVTSVLAELWRVIVKHPKDNAVIGYS